MLENVRVTDKKAAQNDPAVQEAVSKVSEELGDTGRILVRESGTEPVVRVMVEAPDHNTCQKYVDEVVNMICEKGSSAKTAGYFSLCAGVTRRFFAVPLRSNGNRQRTKLYK